MNRKVLLLIELDQTREFLSDMEDDSMDITTMAFEHNILLSANRPNKSRRPPVWNRQLLLQHLGRGFAN